MRDIFVPTPDERGNGKGSKSPNSVKFEVTPQIYDRQLK
jgi:hypothetical protein